VGRKIPKIVINMYVGKGSYTVKIANLISESEPIIRIPTIFHLTYILTTLNPKVVSFSFSFMYIPNE
jgi:hypothetical protein